MRATLITAAFCALAIPAAANADSFGTAAHSSTYSAHAVPEGMRDTVSMRMGPEQRINELVETTVLNRLALEHDAVRNLHRSGDGYSAEVLTAEGTWEPVSVDTTDWDASG